MFRRRTDESVRESSASANETPADTLRRLQEEGKGRPTPTRRDAEAARRNQLKPTRDRRALAKRERQRRLAERQQIRASLAAGDELHLPARDQGPVRRFCREFVDSRRNVAQYLLPLLLLILVLSVVPTLYAAQLMVWALTIALTTVDTIWLSVRLKRELRQRFEPRETKGALAYSLLRSTQIRRLRLPKPQVSYGEQLSRRY